MPIGILMRKSIELDYVLDHLYDCNLNFEVSTLDDWSPNACDTFIDRCHGIVSKYIVFLQVLFGHG